MEMSRRQFNRAAAMSAGAAAMPPMPVSMKSGGDDAYETILREFFRVEEAAHRAGGVSSGAGAVSRTGRQLEGFISHLDMRVSPFESSAQVFRELRGYLERKSRDVAERSVEQAKSLVEDSVRRTRGPRDEKVAGNEEPDEETIGEPTSTSRAS